MKSRSLIASLVLTILSGCASQPKDKPVAYDPSRSLPPTAAGIPAETRYFPSIQDAENALAGYNYGLTVLADGRVQAHVTGLHGSGLGNAIAESQGTGSSGAITVAQHAGEESEKPFPQITLKEKKNGQAAIDALGDKIDEVAEAYGMSPERLAEILRTDSTAWIDERGRMLYIDTSNDLPQGQGAEATGTASGGSTFGTIATTTGDPFALHSKPGANRVIYLDFNGYDAVNTAWYAGTLNAQAYDTDGVPGSFSTTELNNIREIWQRVAEDFAPFDVDVTTQEPPIDALQRMSSSDVQFGTRAVITKSMPQLCNQTCGGVAYVNSFSWYSSSSPDYYQPAWIFFDKLGSVKSRAEAASHEVGHNLNLNHDGTATTGYYTGHGSGATGWAPIMGVGYYKPVTQWSKGEYPGANNQQDDIAVINSAGTPLRADDYPDAIASAAPLGGDATAVAQTGLIERTTDVDVFGFASGSGTAQFTVSPDNVAPNLDVQIKVFNEQGGVVAQANPADTLSASLSVSLTAGNYFLQVEGVGTGDLTTGYSDYGSLGQYQITGNYPAGIASSNNPPTAVVSALPSSGYAPLTISFEGGSSTDSDGSIASYAWNFGDGASGSGASVSHAYNAIGNYTATLTVTDNGGLTNSANQTVQVTQSPVSTSMKIATTQVTRKLVSSSKTQCVATVTVNTGTTPTSGAKVYGTWSGSVSSGSRKITFTSAKSATTGTTGVTTLASPTFPSSYRGTCAMSVTNVTKSGYTYDGSGSTSGSFTW